jgi:hypothetical protein
MILQSIIKCPRCNTSQSATMPSDACQFFYTCAGCGDRLKPKPGDASSAENAGSRGHLSAACVSARGVRNWPRPP